MEYNSNVWFSAITNEDREDIECVQKVACKIILKGEYVDYNQSLQSLNLMSLRDRRQMLAERFAIKCLKSDKFKDLFPENNKKIELRNEEKYLVKFCKGSRLQNSSLPAIGGKFCYLFLGEEGVLFSTPLGQKYRV